MAGASSASSRPYVWARCRAFAAHFAHEGIRVVLRQVPEVVSIGSNQRRRGSQHLCGAVADEGGPTVGQQLAQRCEHASILSGMFRGAEVDTQRNRAISALRRLARAAEPEDIFESEKR